MTTRIGDPARMTSEETVQYVAAVKRVADGPPNQSTGLAFEPQVDKVHRGVRINILSSQLKDHKLFAKVVIEENRLVAMHTVVYTETVQPKPGIDPEVMKTSFLDRLNPSHVPHAASINATIQVPEVDTRRVEGEWLIPSDGALLVSLGPRTLNERRVSQGTRGTFDRHHRASDRRAGAGSGPCPATRRGHLATAPLNSPSQRDILSSA